MLFLYILIVFLLFGVVGLGWLWKAWVDLLPYVPLILIVGILWGIVRDKGKK